MLNHVQPEAELASAWSSFKLHNRASEPEAFLKAHFETTRYISQRAASTSSSSAAYHLHGLLNERLGYYDEAVSAFEEAVKLVEAEYEETETAEVENKYVLSNISLARARIANEDHTLAITALEAALGLLSAENGGGQADAAILKTQAILLKALANFWMDSAQECLEAFEEARSALDEVPDDTEDQTTKRRLTTQVTLLLSRVLYALGGDEQVEEAERQLLDK